MRGSMIVVAKVITGVALTALLISAGGFSWGTPNAATAVLIGIVLTCVSLII